MKRVKILKSVEGIYYIQFQIKKIFHFLSREKYKWLFLQDLSGENWNTDSLNVAKKTKEKTEKWLDEGFYKEVE